MNSTTARLSVMMFLQFFIWGSWYVTIGVYLSRGIDYPSGIGTAYSVGPLGAIFAPIFLGLIADRFFPTQIVLGVLHLLGAVLMWFVPGAIASEMASDNGVFFWMLLGYMLCYMPTLGLSTSLAMHHLEDSEKQFPMIRVFGTIGWIAAGFVVGNWLKADATVLPMQIAAGASLLLGIYSFFLPHTPPPARGQKASISEALGFGSIKMLADKNFAVFAIASLVVCLPLQAYYSFAPTFITDAGFKSAAGVMLWGQVSEILVMLAIPFFFARLGVKWMFAIGIACWSARYGLFAIGAPDAVRSMIFIGILIHGICYDFFFVAGQIYTDKKAPSAIRSQAQGFLIFLTQGVGMYLGAKINTPLFEARVHGENTLAQWPSFWWIPCTMAAAVLFLFIILFNDRVTSKPE